MPAQSDQHAIGEEVTSPFGPQNVLNRLLAFTHQRGIPKGRRDRLRRTLADLLYARCSERTHTDVTVDVALFVFLQTYVALGEILTLKDNPEVDDA